MNVTLAAHEDEYKTFQFTISVGMSGRMVWPGFVIVVPYANQRFADVRRMLCFIGATDVFLLPFKF